MLPFFLTHVCKYMCVHMLACVQMHLCVQVHIHGVYGRGWREALGVVPKMLSVLLVLRKVLSWTWNSSSRPGWLASGSSGSACQKLQAHHQEHPLSPHPASHPLLILHGY